MLNLEVEINSLKGGTKKQREEYRFAMKVLEIVVNSTEFRTRVENYNFTRNGVLTNGFTFSYLRERGSKKYYNPHQIYTMFMTGRDAFNKEADGDIDVSTTIYYKRWSKTVGYTYKNTFKTWINSAKWSHRFNKRIAGIVGNTVHEYKHNEGFEHPVPSTWDRPYSVPYAYGTIAFDLAMEYLQSKSIGNGKLINCG